MYGALPFLLHPYSATLSGGHQSYPSSLCSGSMPDHILRIGPYHEEYKDEEEEVITEKVLERIKREQSYDPSLPPISFSTSFDPTILCVLAMRSSWEQSHPATSLLLAGSSILSSVTQITISYLLFFRSTDPGASEWERLNVLSRGIHNDDASQDMAKYLCFVLYGAFCLASLIKTLRDLQLQLLVLDPLPYNKTFLPILSALGLFLDWIAMGSSLVTGFVVVSETLPQAVSWTASGEAVASSSCIPYFQTMAIMAILARSRIYLCHCCVMAIGLVTGDDTTGELTQLLQSMPPSLSPDEKFRLVKTVGSRSRAEKIIVVLLVLALCFLVYELGCPGYFQNCTGIRIG